MKENKLESICLISVSKGEKRNAGREIIHTKNHLSVCNRTGILGAELELSIWGTCLDHFIYLHKSM